MPLGRGRRSKLEGLSTRINIEASSASCPEEPVFSNSNTKYPRMYVAWPALGTLRPKFSDSEPKSKLDITACKSIIHHDSKYILITKSYHLAETRLLAYICKVPAT